MKPKKFLEIAFVLVKNELSLRLKVANDKNIKKEQLNKMVASKNRDIINVFSFIIWGIY